MADGMTSEPNTTIGRVAERVRAYFACGGRAAVDVAQRKAWTYEDLGLPRSDDRQEWP
jgi:hypothetical protein